MNAVESEMNFQKVWNLFAETDRRFKETEQRFKETDQKFKETDQKFKETDQKFKETEQRFKETDQKFKETDQRLDKLFKETDRKIGKLTGKWGMFVEGLILPAVEQLFKERGIEVSSIHQRVRVHKNGGGMEIDILAVNGEYAILIETKSSLSTDDVKEHLERLGKFRYFFPEYSNRKALGAVAGIVIEEGAGRYAYKKGLFVIGQSGETVRILNSQKFTPKEW